MTPDLSRDSFNRQKNFTRVIMQQGRVQLDADWNEQADIFLAMARDFFTALVGPNAGPADAADTNFKITYVPGNVANVPADLNIGTGTHYVAGLRCSNRDSNASYLHQPYLTIALGPQNFPSVYPYLVYLDAWEEPVTVLDDDDLREPALGGLDTAARARVRWAVRIIPAADAVQAGGTKPGDPTTKFSPTVIKAFTQTDSAITDLTTFGLASDDPEKPQIGMRLKIVASDESNLNTPCAIAPDSRYRGTENQLYRVEIHSGGPSPTIKWSRDNGATAIRITALGSDDEKLGPWKATLADLGRDSLRTLAIGDWVEIVDSASASQPPDAPPHDLLLVTDIDRDNLIVTLERALKMTNDHPAFPGVPESIVYSSADINRTRPLLRRWNQSGNVVAEKDDKDIPIGVIKIDKGHPDNWYELEDGLFVQFPMLDSSHSPNFRVGDYWLVPARTADNGSVLWPPAVDGSGQPIKDGDSPVYGPMPPDGIRHYYAPLAVVVDPADKADYPFLGSDPAATVIDRRWKINLAIQAPKFPT